MPRLFSSIGMQLGPINKHPPPGGDGLLQNGAQNMRGDLRCLTCAFPLATVFSSFAHPNYSS